MLSTSVNLLQTWWYVGLKSTQTPRTHSLTQPLPSNVYLWRNGRSHVAKMPDYTLTVDFSMFGCSQLPPTVCKYGGIPASSPRRYPTHILSHNHPIRLDHTNCLQVDIKTHQQAEHLRRILWCDRVILFRCHCGSFPWSTVFFVDVVIIQLVT